ncbi:hypothetical protein FB157_11626 [Streptomyces sp. BK340]|nr:hypothetical protein FB157_11626 [Streptomyces sp. BK340]
MKFAVVGATSLIGAKVVKKLNVAGPEVFPLDELGPITLNARSDSRTVVTDDTAGMFSALPGDALIAKGDTRIAPTHYRDWLS